MMHTFDSDRPWAIGGTPLTLLLVAATAQISLADAAPWWNHDWTYRRVVRLPTARTSLEDSDATWVEFLTHGAARKDGNDLRVATYSGELVRHFVMQMGPGDFARICFEARPREKTCYVYYGNPKASANPDPWRPRRGVLLEGWRFRGGSIASYTQTLRTFERAGEPQGRTFVPNVFIGHNPFGVPSHYCHKYTGWLICPAQGEYLFATTSKDASFLLIDDEVVVQWPGRHGPVGDARHHARTRLDKGLHKLTYYHVSHGANGRAVAAWQPPGQTKPKVIPPNAFAPITQGKVEALQHHRGKFLADFTVEGPFEAFFKDRYSYRYVFEATTGDRYAGKTDYRWEFGDGTSAEGRKVEHVFLAPGLRKITLHAARGRRGTAVASELLVTRDWNRITQSEPEPIKRHADIVSAYAVESLSAADLISAIWMLFRTGRHDKCLSALAALPGRVNDADARSVAKVLPELHELLLRGDPRTRELEPHEALARRAPALFEAIESAADNVRLKAVASALAGLAHLHVSGDRAQAEACFRRTLERYGDRTRDPAIRQARIGLGDVSLATGRYRQAKRAYEQAGAVGKPHERTVQVGSYARAVEDYIRRGEYQEAAERLDRWEWEYPKEKLRGYSTLLRARLHFRQNHHARVVRLLEGVPLVVVEPEKDDQPVDVIDLTIDPKKLRRLYKVDAVTGRVQSASGIPFPPNPYGMEMGLLAVDSQLKLNHKDRAKQILGVLIQLYPDSPQVGEARERLKKLGG